MSATTFSEIYVHMQCRSIAEQALRSLQGHESPIHPSAALVDAVLAGVCCVGSWFHALLGF